MHSTTTRAVNVMTAGLQTQEQRCPRAWWRRRGLGEVGLVWVLGLVVPGGWEVRAAEAPRRTSAEELAQLSIEELMAVKIETVSTPSRYAQNVAQAPSAVSVVTWQDIEQFGYRTLADVLSSVRGVRITSDRSYTYLGMRGFSRPSDYNSRTLVLVDGHRVNDALFGGAYIGREFVLDVDLIDRVEVVRGPTSSLYGSSAVFGVVNVITKRPADLLHAEGSGEVGPNETYKGRFTYAGVSTNAGVDLTLSGSYFDTAGQPSLYYKEFDDPASNDGFANNMDHERASNLYASARWRELSVTGAYVAREKNIPTASWETVFNDSRYRTVDEHGYVSLKWQHPIGEDQDLMARAYFDDTRYNADYPNFVQAPGDEGLGRDDDWGQTLGGELQYILRWKEHTFTVGAEGRDHLRMDQTYYDVEPRVVYFNDARRSFDFGGYAQAELSLRTNLLFSAGVRYDYYDSFGGTANPRLALIYSPWLRSNFKLLYGKAFRAPNAFELYYDAPPTNLGNPDLEPEDIHTYEAVYEQRLPGNMKVALAGYYYDINNLISQVEVAPSSFQWRNVEEARAAGIETEMEWRHASGFRARASYALQRTEDEAGDALSNSPLHLAKLNVVVPLWRDRVFTGFELQFTSSAKTLPERAAAQAEAFWVANWTLFSQQIVKNVELSATIYNLFDTAYSVPGGTAHTQDLIAQDGRSFRVKLTYRF
jgi:iron complex outermembrane receptor protein